MKPYTHDAILELHRAAIALSFDRNALLQGVPPEVVSSIPLATTTAAQILSDLTALNASELTDGAPPLHRWLQNARLLSVGRIDGVVFDHYLRDCDGGVNYEPVSLRHDIGTTHPLHKRSRRDNDDFSARNSLALSVALAIFVLAVVLVATRSSFLTPVADSLVCPPGRQAFQGTCVADKMVDLLVCIERNTSSDAWQAVLEVLKANRESTANDPALRARLEDFLTHLKERDLQQIQQFCREAVEEAGLILPSPAPSASTTEQPISSVRTVTDKPPALRPSGEPPSDAHASTGDDGSLGDFNKSAATAALDFAAMRAQNCRKSGDPMGQATVRVVFAPSGRVTSATVQGPPFAGTDIGGCVATAFRSAQVPPFDGGPVAVTKNVAIRH